MEQILNLIDSFSAGFINLLKMIAMHFCGLAVTAIGQITDPRVRGALNLVVFLLAASLMIYSIVWWFRRLSFFLSSRSPIARQSSLHDLVWLMVATVITPSVFLLVCFFFLCWWQSV